MMGIIILIVKQQECFFLEYCEETFRSVYTESPGSNMMSVSGQRPISADCSMKHGNGLNYLIPGEDVAVKEMRTATQQ